jgi:pyruvate/2-oxoglutarate dehydrogenase complex dihydrolipoamide dehydrogenase (E3) component
MLRAARAVAEVRRAPELGVDVGYSRVDYPRVVDHIDTVIRQIAPHDSPERLRELGVEVRFGSVRFLGPHVLELDGERLHARRITVATGSRPLVPPIPGLGDVDLLTNETVFGMRQLPRRLAVIGGGPIGVELGQCFARFGSEVTLCEALDALLPRDDPELTALLQRRLEADGVDVLVGHRVAAVEAVTNGKRLHLEPAPSGGAARAVEVDAILVATGRRPGVEGLDLEAAGVRVEPDGIPVDRRMRTSIGHIYACGDVTGRHAFTHMAEHQAKTVIQNAVLGLPVAIDERAVPWATFTDPELARVGMSESEARAAGKRFVVHRFPMDHVDRAITDGTTVGLVKVLATPWRGRILGAHILGERAGDLIAEFTLAMQHGIGLDGLARTIHVYPTLALGSRRAADQRYRQLMKPAILRWIRRLRGFRGDLPPRDPDALL